MDSSVRFGKQISSQTVASALFLQTNHIHGREFGAEGDDHDVLGLRRDDPARLSEGTKNDDGGLLRRRYEKVAPRGKKVSGKVAALNYVPPLLQRARAFFEDGKSGSS